MKKTDKKALFWIFKCSKHQIVNIILITVFYAFIAIIGVCLSLITKSLIDGAVNKEIDTIISFSAILISLVVFQIIINIVCRVIIFNINAKLEISIKTNLFKNILRKNYSDIKEYHSGELINRLTSDISVVTGTITMILPQLSFLAVKLLGVFIVLFSIDYVFALIFFVAGILIFFVSQIFKKKIKSFHKKAQETDGKVRSFLQEIIESLLVVKVFRAEKKVKDNAVDLQNENYKIKRKRNYFSIFTTTGFSFVFTIGYFYGMIWGAFNIYSGLITYGTLTAVLSLISQIQGPISGLTGIIPQYYSALASAERIMEIENIKDEAVINDKNIDVNSIYSDLKSIEFENITFSYDKEKIFDNTSLSINKGDYVVITGISGIGKSTLTRLLLSVFPLDNGEIYLKLNNGKQIFVDKRLRKMFAYVPQGNFVLSGTIRENISFIRPDATDEEIMEAARISCADEFINNLPHGLDTVLGEKGSGLSEGQIQRIAIARAVICKAPVLLLDEATSALDMETEKKLLENLKNERGHMTLILVSHKLAANSVCNKEVRIEDEKIIVSEINNENTH
ncbi:MAG: ABC transporter ATP-binding protein [Ruminococcus sp.]|nr:ABC transporter ATP-binding protein [Ruminococcus sp.]